MHPRTFARKPANKVMSFSHVYLEALTEVLILLAVVFRRGISICNFHQRQCYVWLWVLFVPRHVITKSDFHYSITFH